MRHFELFPFTITAITTSNVDAPQRFGTNSPWMHD
jgi:hypothetical protein